MLKELVLKEVLSAAAKAAINRIASAWEKFSEKRRATAQSNVNSVEVKFGDCLAKRWPDMQLHQERLRLVEENLSEPATAAFMETVGAVAAQVSAPEAQDLLARLVLERLTAPARSTLACMTAAAVDLIPRMEARHISYLAALSWFSLQYAPPPTLDTATSLLPVFERNMNSALEKLLEPCKTNHVDIEYLLGLGVIRGVVMKVECSRRTMGLFLGKYVPTPEELRSLTAYDKFCIEYERLELGTVSHTALGQVIGKIRRDSVFGEETPWQQMFYHAG